MADVASTFNSISPELARIPSDVVKCYVNSTLWSRVNRVPFSIKTLTTIVRKLEGDTRISSWTAGRLAANIIHSFR